MLSRTIQLFSGDHLLSLLLTLHLSLAQFHILIGVLPFLTAIRNETQLSEVPYLEQRQALHLHTICWSYFEYPTPNALLCIAGCPTSNALLRIAECPTPNALLRVAGCPTLNVLLRIGMTCFVQILYGARLRIKSLLQSVQGAVHVRKDILRTC